MDPVANAMVFGATTVRPRFHVLYGLDVTYECQMKSDEVRKRFATKSFDIVRELAEVWFGKEKAGMTFHDPLAAASIFKPELCTYRDGKIVTDANMGPLAGMTALHPEEGGPHRVAEKVDAPAFFKEYFGVFT